MLFIKANANIVQFYEDIFILLDTFIFFEMRNKKKLHYLYAHASKCTRDLSGIIILSVNR